MAVYFDGIDHFSHGFMRFNPPRMKWVPEKEYELYKDVVEAGYRFHDMMLGVLMSLAGEETTHTRIRTLDDAERIDEIARMLGGVKITRQTREHAREMISQAQTDSKPGRRKPNTRRA